MYRGDCTYIDGYNCVGRDVKLLTPNGTVSGDRAYQKVIKEIGPTRRSRAGHRSHRISVLIKKNTRELSLSLYVHRQKKSHVMTQARSQPSMSWEESSLTRNQICHHLDHGLFNLLDCAKINFCYLSHPPYGSLLWQLNLIQIFNKNPCLKGTYFYLRVPKFIVMLITEQHVNCHSL